jgi:asparagine synthetase B (glutamine-hydrolysing)
MTNPKRLDWLSEAERAIAAAVEKHGQCALLYSGGIESSLLLHLAARRRARLSVEGSCPFGIHWFSSPIPVLY